MDYISRGILRVQPLNIHVSHLFDMILLCDIFPVSGSLDVTLSLRLELERSDLQTPPYLVPILRELHFQVNTNINQLPIRSTIGLRIVYMVL